MTHLVNTNKKIIFGKMKKKVRKTAALRVLEN